MVTASSGATDGGLWRFDGAHVLARAIAAKDPEMGAHADEVATLATSIAVRLGLGEAELADLRLGSMLHDVGKVWIPDAILRKPIELTAAEMAVVMRHPRIGAGLAAGVPGVAPIILHHHERWDGTGYPDGLAGETIPLAARIVAVADSFSAMTAQRPYRAALRRDAACAELERCAGTQFDPQLVALFIGG